MDRIKKNKVSKALFLIQKALLVYNNMEQSDISETKSLLEVKQAEYFHDIWLIIATF